MRHTDRIAIGDLGLPVPIEVEEIDLALTFDTPSFIDVLSEVLKDLKTEKIILAEELKANNPEQLENIKNVFKSYEIEVEFVSHENFKQLLKSTKAVIRTGETTPYSNIILQSDVIF